VCRLSRLLALLEPVSNWEASLELGLRMKNWGEILNKPIPVDDQSITTETFSPWNDVIDFFVGGGYSSEIDDIFINALWAAKGGNLSYFRDAYGVMGELVFGILVGADVFDYGTSPRYPFLNISQEQLDRLISNWERYYVAVWGETYKSKWRCDDA